MGYTLPAATKSGKFRAHEPVDGWPTVIISTFRRTDDGVFEDILQLKTAYPPALGEFVQGLDYEYHKVVSIKRSYQVDSTPVIYVTCEIPRAKSLNC